MRAVAAGLVLVTVGVAAALTFARAAGSLPPNPWTGQWRAGDGSIATLTQSGNQITGTGPCAGGDRNPAGVRYTGTVVSAEGSIADFTYAGAPSCPGEGGTFRATLRADGRVADYTGVTQFGTGFVGQWTYVGGGSEPRSTPTTTTSPQPPRGRAVRFSYQGFANNAVPVTLRRFQLGVVRVQGAGRLQTDGDATSGAAHRASIDQRRFGYGASSMRAAILSGALTKNTASTRVVRLQARVVASSNRRGCTVGTRGTITLVDSSRKLANGQTADRWEALWPDGHCPTFTQGTDNRASPNTRPTRGGRGGGQFADVRITVG